MISMYSKKEVLTYHIVYGWGAKKIHSEMVREGKYPPSWDTIRKLLNKYDAALDSGGKEAAEEYFRTRDAFNTPVREHYKLDAQARAYIESCIRENERKKQENNRKQCIDMQKVWDILRHDMGYDICYSTVTAYAREYRAALPDFIYAPPCFTLSPDLTSQTRT